MVRQMDPNAAAPQDASTGTGANSETSPLVSGLGPASQAVPETGGFNANADVIKDSNQENFAADVIDASSEVPIIVDFWAPWCEPCKTLGPALEKLVRKAGGTVRMVKINIDENQQLAQQMRIQSIPMVYAFKDGRPVDRFQGVVPESQLKSFIKKAIGDAKPPIEAALEQAAELLEAGDGKGASDVYAQILDADAENSGAIAGLIRCAITASDFDTAHAIIDGLTPQMLKDADVSAATAALELAEATSGEEGNVDIEPLLAQLGKNPNDHQARYDLAMAYYGSGQNQQAIEALIKSIRLDRTWNDEAARQQLLKIFEALGHSNPLTMDGRRLLSAVLFS